MLEALGGQQEPRASAAMALTTVRRTAPSGCQATGKPCRTAHRAGPQPLAATSMMVSHAQRLTLALAPASIGPALSGSRIRPRSGDTLTRHGCCRCLTSWSPSHGLLHCDAWHAAIRRRCPRAAFAVQPQPSRRWPRLPDGWEETWGGSVCCTPGPGIGTRIPTGTPWCREVAGRPMARTGGPHGKTAWGRLSPSPCSAGPRAGSHDHRPSGFRLSIHRCGKETGGFTVSLSAAERPHGGRWPPPAAEWPSAITTSFRSKTARSPAGITKPKPARSATPRAPPRRASAAGFRRCGRLGSAQSAPTGGWLQPSALGSRRPERGSGAGPRALKQPAQCRRSKHERKWRAAPHGAAC